MAKNLKKGGYAVISGFIDDQVEWVVGEHEKQGLKLVKLYEKGQAIEVREKNRISEECTVGLYYFKTCKLYENL